ncbi:MAG: internalization-related competence protein ComEC/Rec2 [Chromatiaceae bacterium]|nr:internalization-related competence protein ComEC/Rec2 [Chromatiaceae bacterium]
MPGPFEPPAARAPEAPVEAADKGGVPMASLAPAFAAGVGAFYFFPEMPPPGLGLLLACIAAVLACLPRPRLARFIAAMLVGVLWAMLHLGTFLWKPFPDLLARAPLLIEGRIVSIPADEGFARRFLFQVERVPVPSGSPGSASGSPTIWGRCWWTPRPWR